MCNIEVEQCLKQKIHRWKFKTADWKKYKEGNESKMLGVENERKLRS